jgi:hypothetical protein
MCLNPQKSLKERKRTWTDLYYNSQQLSLGWTEGFSLASYSAITAFTSSYYAGLPSLKTHVLSVDAQHLAHCWAVYSWCLVNMLLFFFFKLLYWKSLLSSNSCSTNEQKENLWQWPLLESTYTQSKGCWAGKPEPRPGPAKPPGTRTGLLLACTSLLIVANATATHSSVTAFMLCSDSFCLSLSPALDCVLYS